MRVPRTAHVLPATPLAYNPCPCTLRHPRGLVSPGSRTGPSSMLSRRPPLPWQVRVGDPQAASAALSDAVRPDAVRPDAVRPDAVRPDAALPDAAACCDIQSIMEFMYDGASFSVVRLWCLTQPVVDDAESGQTWAALGESPRIQMLSFESVHVQVVSCVPTDTCIQLF